MSKTAADVLIETIHDWGVDVIFGLPGDGINGIMEALRTHQEKVRFIQVHHEEAAAFMACAYAKFTGKLGVCLGTSGPGSVHLLDGLYDAKLDGQPVLAMTGMAYHDLVNTYTQQDIEFDKLFMDVAQYNTRVMGAHACGECCGSGMPPRQRTAKRCTCPRSSLWQCGKDPADRVLLSLKRNTSGLRRAKKCRLGNPLF